MARFPIIFPDSDPKTHEVTVALAPTDAFTGEPVTRGVEAWLWDEAAERKRLHSRPVRNPRGQLVFLGLPAAPAYTFILDASEAGYRGDQRVEFVTPPPDDPRPKGEQLLQVVLLQRRPDAAFAFGTTLVRGAIVRRPEPDAGAAPEARVPAGGATVRAEPLAGGGAQFEAEADGRGIFALPLRLPPPGAGEAPQPIEMRLAFAAAEGAPARVLVRTLHDGRTHVFRTAIDLDGDNEPPFEP